MSRGEEERPVGDGECEGDGEVNEGGREGGGGGGGCEEVEREKDSNDGTLAIAVNESQVQPLKTIGPVAPTAECPICLEEPGLAHSVITTCGHILCLVCAKLLIKVNKKCPICSCPLGDKDYVGLARLQQKEKTSISNNDKNNDDKCGHEDEDKKHDGSGSRSESGGGGGVGKENETVMSTEMEVIHLEDSNIDNNDRDEKSTEVEVKGNGKTEAAAAAAAAAATDSMGKEIREGGSDSALRVVGNDVMMDVDAVRVAEKITGRSNAKEISSRGSHVLESTTMIGTGTGTGTGTEVGSKENYKNDDYRRWGGERFHKSVSLICLLSSTSSKCLLSLPSTATLIHILVIF